MGEQPGAADVGLQVETGAPAAEPVYVYAVMPLGAAVTLPATGIDPTRPVTTLAVGAVQAVVSTVPSERFNQATVEAGLANRSWLETHVLAHQRVLDVLVASDYPVIPLRFCTIYRDEAAVRSSLSQSGHALSAELERLADKKEWGVKQIIDLQLLQREMLANGPAVQPWQDESVARLQQQIAGMKAGAAFLLQKKLSALVADRALAVAYAIADATHLALAAQSVAAITSPLPQDRPEVCLNGAYLVAAAQFPAFQAALEALAQEYRELGVSYEFSGPWPPHHFLQLDWAAAEGQ